MVRKKAAVCGEERCVRTLKTAAKETIATQPRAFILSDRNIFYTPRGGTTAGSNAPGAFLVLPFIFGGPLPQTSARSKQNLPVVFVRLAFIRQNLYEGWCRKLLAI